MLKTNFPCGHCGVIGVEITNCEDYFMEVFCGECGEEWVIEPDGFGDGGLVWAEAMQFFNEAT